MINTERNLRSQKATFDYWLIFLTAILTIIGLIAIYDASVVAAFRDFQDKFYYFKNQLIWATLGVFILGFFAFFDYHKLLKISLPLVALSIILLVLVLIPGIGTKIYGARRWINLGDFTFQPSEFAKLAVILYSSTVMAKIKDYSMKLVDVFIVLFLPIAIISALVLLEPDLGTALIIVALLLNIYFIGGAPLWHFLVALPPLLFGIIVAIVLEPYRIARLKSFLDPSVDPQGISYQINQILVALSAGGLLGVGLGASRSKFAFIPEVQSDAIFAVIVEEIGLIGALILIFLFLGLIWRSIEVAKNAADYQGRVLAIGITGWLAIQILFNVASVVALVPLTGVPLPFISYGGSSLLVTMIGIGILINISKQR